MVQLRRSTNGEVNNKKGTTWYECDKECHLENDCPNLAKCKTKLHSKPNEKVREKRAYIAWNWEVKYSYTNDSKNE